MAKQLFLFLMGDARGVEDRKTGYEGLQYGDSNSISKHPTTHTDLKKGANGGSNNGHGHGQGELLPRFWLRTLTCTVVPLLITAYYAGLYAYWILRYDDGGPMAQGPPAGRWAYYICATGIGLSKYGLAGVEAGMLMDKRWAAKNAMQLMSHCEKTWSGPSGWFRMRTKPSPTWLVLAAVSLTPYIALPLSGSTLQLTTGYSASNSSTSYATLVGQRPDTFLDQNLQDVFTRSFNRWSTSTSSTLSSRSAYYVPADNSTLIDRTWLQSFPNTWPDWPAMSVFIAPQSTSVVAGDAWGLESTFNCTIVSDISQFTLLSQRNSDSSAPRCPPITFNSSDATPEYMGLPNLCDFDVYTLNPISNATLVDLNVLDSAFFPVGTMEMAVGYNKSEWESIPFSNLDPVTIEAALWQNPIEMVQTCAPLQRLASNALGTTVSGLQKSFRLDEVTSELTGQDDMTPKTLDAIGFRCQSRYRTGTATLDGRTGTYDDFSYSEASPMVSATPVPIATAIARIFRSEVSAALSLQDMYGQTALTDAIDSLPLDFTEGSNMDLNPMAYIASNVSWLQNIYKSADAFYRQPLYCDDQGNVNVSLTSTWQQLQLINSTQFMTSIIRAFKAYALEMARPRTTVQGSGSHQSQSQSALQWTDRLVRTVQPALIISSGHVSPVPVLVLLMVWATSCVVLGVVFGARRRWSETLDGFSMFRFGADFGNPNFQNHAFFSEEERSSTRHFSESAALLDTPGLVGDSRPESAVGYISLVDGPRDHAADRRKKYV
ncbi:hypothetical protein LTR46_001567 [Exophiala xenobiotica]|nr:hypothetical protein LTR18_009513 [Exophiala xenobiotica]KAK5559818.1 hypothetical protein LTR46_001567 [Exophiala xenobiotica]